MKYLTRNLLVILISCLATACTTPYQSYGFTGGYSDSHIDENTFSVNVETNGFTSKQTTFLYALYRAAELTVENGFDYFIVINSNQSTNSMAMISPGYSTSNTTINSYGSRAYGTTTTTSSPSIISNVEFPVMTLTIKSFKGAKPGDSSSAYDARSVMKHLASKIGVKEKG